MKSYSVFEAPIKVFGIPNFEKDKSIVSNVANSTVFRKRARKERIGNVESIGYELMNLENELSELYIVRNMLEKNLVNIKYFQEKIVGRISSRLHYKIVND